MVVLKMTLEGEQDQRMLFFYIWRHCKETHQTLFFKGTGRE
jgi:hypothetical protein